MLEGEVPAAVFVCRCGAAMTGPPKGDQPWSCAKAHLFRVTSGGATSGATIGAIALRGDYGAGVEKGRNYLWRPSPGAAQIRASPR